VEAPLRQYRVIPLTPSDTLSAVAERYNTTVEVLRMANALAPTVETGDGSAIIVPEGVQSLDPPRTLDYITAQPGESLESLAQRFRIPLNVLELDNPVLAQRRVNPGDIVFIPTLL
jgi:LysM repeat protein